MPIYVLLGETETCKTRMKRRSGRRYASAGPLQMQIANRRRRSNPDDYSPYGTQIFLTCVACSRNQRPSACLGLNQSIVRPSFVQTCFRFPLDIAFAAATVASSP